MRLAGREVVRLRYRQGRWPLAGSVCDDLEMGISAHSFGPGTAVLYLDDVTLRAGADPEIMPNAAGASIPGP